MLLPEQYEEHERDLDRREGDRIHEAIAYSERENHNLLKAVDRLEQQIAALVKALEEIAKGEGPYSRNRLTHAENTIAHMVLIASQALALVEGE